jgi:hypothetical protein
MGSMGSSKSNKNKLIKSVWCVLLVGLLLVAVAEAYNCDELCGWLDFGEFDDCMAECTAPRNLHRKHFAGEKHQGEEARRNVLPTASAVEE